MSPRPSFTSPSTTPRPVSIRVRLLRPQPHNPAVKAARNLCRVRTTSGRAATAPKRRQAIRPNDASQTDELLISAGCLKTSRRHRGGDRDKGYSDSDPTVHANSRLDSRSSDRRYDRGRNSRLDMVRIRADGMRHPDPDISPGRIRRPLRQDATA